MGKYIDFEQVRLRLVGKVRFAKDNDGDDENRMSVALAGRLIAEAEGQVELDLSPRYLAPFQGDAGERFGTLPSTTQQIIKTLCELVSVSRILETDFGTGSATDGEKYRKAIDKRYEQIRDQLLAKRKDGSVDSQGFRYPPLPNLKLNYMNAAADSGYMGSVIVASGSPTQGYPKGQINDPALNFWNGWPSDCD